MRKNNVEKNLVYIILSLTLPFLHFNYLLQYHFYKAEYRNESVTPNGGRGSN